jgi:hypothetical protein
LERSISAVTGSGAVAIHQDRRIGETSMLAIAPEHDRHGLGRATDRTAPASIRSAGVPVAMVESRAQTWPPAARRAPRY